MDGSLKAKGIQNVDKYREKNYLKQRIISGVIVGLWIIYIWIFKPISITHAAITLILDIGDIVVNIVCGVLEEENSSGSI